MITSSYPLRVKGALRSTDVCQIVFKKNSKTDFTNAQAFLVSACEQATSENIKTCELMKTASRFCTTN